MSKSKQLRPGVKPRLGHNITPSTPPVDDEPPIVSFDVEWARHPTDPMQNQVLVYGMRLEHRGESKTCFFYPKGRDRRSRLTLAAMLSQLFDRSIPQIIPTVPRCIVLIGHYARGDLSACKDFAVLKRQFDNVKGAFVSSKGRAAIELRVDPKTGMPIDHLPRMPDHRVMNVTEGGGGSCEVGVTFRDTSLLVVDGGRGSLDAIGELVGLPQRLTHN